MVIEHFYATHTLDVQYFTLWKINLLQYLKILFLPYRKYNISIKKINQLMLTRENTVLLQESYET